MFLDDKKRHAADNTHISSTNAAIDGFDISLAGADTNYIGGIGTARTNYQQNMIQPLGTHATGLATANMVFHTSRVGSAVRTISLS